MVLITEELVRKRSEHNERVISTLEELSLHQEDIEKIDLLQNWCPGLKILLLQSNIILKIENLNKMKHLEYLNLALNNIEIIENLEGCESLQKLDLTLNFIGELESVKRLKRNLHLETLFLTGNPCSDYEGYREYVIAVLPNLRVLDGVEIERSDRIKALQAYDLLNPGIVAAQIDYKKKRKKQIIQAENKQRTKMENNTSSVAEDEKFWKEVTDNTPETRIQMAKHKTAIKQQKTEDNPKPNKRQVQLFKPNGQPKNINEAKIPFSIKEDDERNSLVLTIGVYKYLDSSHLDVDVQPHYVTTKIKGKVFQITLSEEVSVTQSTAQRSQTTGHLVITMPKLKGEIKKLPSSKLLYSENKDIALKNTISKREYLEIGVDDKSMDFSRIIEIRRANKTNEGVQNMAMTKKYGEKNVSSNFEDDFSVPPLI